MTISIDYTYRHYLVILLPELYENFKQELVYPHCINHALTSPLIIY